MIVGYVRHISDEINQKKDQEGVVKKKHKNTQGFY